MPLLSPFSGYLVDAGSSSAVRDAGPLHALHHLPANAAGVEMFFQHVQRGPVQFTSAKSQQNVLVRHPRLSRPFLGIAFIMAQPTCMRIWFGAGRWVR